MLKKMVLNFIWNIKLWIVLVRKKEMKEGINIKKFLKLKKRNVNKVMRRMREEVVFVLSSWSV